MTTERRSSIALVGSWADAIDVRRSIAAELAAVWPQDSARVAVFADVTPAMREALGSLGATCWPEGAFGRHFTRDDFDHALLMLGPRLDSILALGRAADTECHVWLQDDVVDSDGFPIDAPDDWLAEMTSGARSVIVGSDWLAGVVRRVAPDGPPILVMPPAHPNVAPIVDPPERVVAVIGADESVRRYLANELGAYIVSLDDPTMTPSVRETRLLSARVGVELRTTERGFASTTVTHMTARGIPTFTTLGAHAPFAASEVTNSGVVVVEVDDDADVLDVAARIVELVRPILDDDRTWLAASTAAKATAASWTWADAADVLAQWMSAVDDLAPSTVRVVGAVAP